MYCYGQCVYVVKSAIITGHSNLTNSKTGTSKTLCRLICLEIISLNYYNGWCHYDNGRASVTYRESPPS